MRPRSYIGVTGFMSRKEVDAIQDIMPEDCKRMLMVGVLANQKTFKRLPQKAPNRNPKESEIGNIFREFAINKTQNRANLNLIHYNTKDSRNLSWQLFKAFQANCDGFQLNIKWPPKEELSNFLECYSVNTIVLQVGGRAMEVLDSSPEQIASKVFEYQGLIDYVLLDPSGGKGKPLNAENLRPHLEAIRSKMPNVGLVAAGGLSSKSLHLIEPLLRDFPDLSIDAEGLLRDKDDHLVIEEAISYVKKALELISKYQ